MGCRQGGGHLTTNNKQNMKENNGGAGPISSKKSIVATVIGATAVLAGPAMADATIVTGAISEVAGDAGTGVTAGVGIGAVVFGARVVWGAIKSMA